MKHFTINSDNNITIHASRKETHAQTAELAFSTEEQFADAIGNDSKRLIEIWNGLPGVTPVKKFTNRKIATERIWKAIQHLGGTVAAAPAPDPEADAIKPDATQVEAPPKNDATPVSPAVEAPAPQVTSGTAVDQPEVPAEPETQQDAVTPAPEVVATIGAQVADVAPAEPDATEHASPKKGTREGSKTARVLELVRQPGGATLKEIMAATDWQAHSVRGFISGNLIKKMGLKVASIKREDGERLYMAN
jgi:hypothetical protein